MSDLMFTLMRNMSDSANAGILYDIVKNDQRIVNAGVTFPARPDAYAFT